MKKWLVCGMALSLLLSGCGAQEQSAAKTAEDEQWRDAYQQFLSGRCEQEMARQLSEGGTNDPIFSVI